MDRRELWGRDARGETQPCRGAQWSSPGRLTPASPVRREDLVVIAAVGSDRGWLYDRHTILHTEVDADALAGRRKSLLPTACVGGHVLADEDRFGADFLAEPQGLGDGVAAPDHQIGAP